MGEHTPTTLVLTSKHDQLRKGVKLYNFATMYEVSCSIGPLVRLEPFRLPDTYIADVEKLVREGSRLYISGDDDNRASFRFVRSGVQMVYRDEFPHFTVFDTVRRALLPGTARGGVYLDIPLFPRDELYGHLVVGYRGIPDAVVAWVLLGLFGIDVVVSGCSE